MDLLARRTVQALENCRADGKRHEEYLRELRMEILKKNGLIIPLPSRNGAEKLGEKAVNLHQRVPQTQRAVSSNRSRKSHQGLICKDSLPYPQHVILYGPLVWETTVARLI